MQLSRHQLHWVSRRRGTVDWPFPFRTPEWPWRSRPERAAAEAAVAEELRGAGLLDPGGRVDPLLDAAARLLGGWTSSVDCVYHHDGAAVVVAVVCDADQAVRIVGADFGGDEPLSLAWADPADPVVALLDVLPPHPPGRGSPVRVPARPGSLGAAGPTTQRSAEGRSAARTIAESATGMGRVGVSVRATADAAPVRGPRLVAFLDSASVHLGGRYELAHDTKGFAMLRPAGTAALAAATRRLRTDTGIAA